MPINKMEKAGFWIYEHLPTQVSGVGASMIHKTNVDESLMNINKDIETIIVGCLTATAVFFVRQGCKELWSRLFPKKKDNEGIV